MKFLYLLTRFPLADVLALEALFQLACVALEVPSGYASDRLGRRPTLLIAALAAAASAAGMGLATSWAGFAAAQLLLAVQFSFQSGTTVAYHAELLESLGCGERLGARESALQSARLWVAAATTLVGGLAGAYDYRIPFALSAAAGLVGAWAAAGFRRGGSDPTRPLIPPGPGEALRRSLALLGRGFFAWAVAASVARQLVDHLPYNFYQPYLDLLGGALADRAAPVAGVHVALSMAFGAWMAARSDAWARRVGFRAFVLAALAYELALAAAMARWLHPAVLGLAVTREVANALIRPAWAARVVPRVPEPVRATFLSVAALGARLGVAALVYAMARVEGGGGHAGLAATLRVGLAVGAAAWVGLAAAALAGFGAVPPTDSPGYDAPA